jgi:intracellular multiplication protein IcmP
MSGYMKTNGDDMALTCIALTGVLGACLYFFWSQSHAAVSYYALKWAWRLLGLWDRPFMPDIFRDMRAELALLARRAPLLSFPELLSALNKAGYAYIWLPLAVTAYGIRAATRHPADRTRRKVTPKTLPEIMSRHAPAVIPVLHYGDLLNDDPESQRSALNPEEWVGNHGLLVNGALDRERCLALLIADLGVAVATLDDMAPHERALFAVFGLRLFPGDAGADAAQELLDALNRSCRTHSRQGENGYPDLMLADALYRKCAALPEARQWQERHPYPRTLLHAMHKAALASGKLPSVHFRWLKGMDRPLWYALNTTGRKAPFIESAAVFTQTLWEEFAFKNGYRLQEPFVDDAVDGVDAYLRKIGLMPPLKQ